MQVTITDIGNLFGFAKAEDLAITGVEKALDLTSDAALLARAKILRGLVAQRVELCQHPERVDEEWPMFPMIVLVSKPAGDEAHIQPGLFLDNKCHTAMALTGAVATTACSKIRNSIINNMLDLKATTTTTFKIQHPGRILPISVRTEYADESGLPSFKTLSFVCTSRNLFNGDIFIPDYFQEKYYSGKMELHVNQISRPMVHTQMEASLEIPSLTQMGVI